LVGIVVKADRQELLVVLRLSLAAELARTRSATFWCAVDDTTHDPARRKRDDLHSVEFLTQVVSKLAQVAPDYCRRRL
jgi:hypothetical protein